MATRVRETVAMQFPEAGSALEKLETAHRSMFIDPLAKGGPAGVGGSGTGLQPSGAGRGVFQGDEDGLSVTESELSESKTDLGLLLARAGPENKRASNASRRSELDGGDVAADEAEWKRWLLTAKTYVLACHHS